MKNESVRKASLLLNLEKKIVGVKFLDFKEDYDEIQIPVAEKNGTVCYHARESMDGKLFKAQASNVSCDYGKYALGLAQADTTILEGRSYDFCGLAESKSIGKSIVESMKYINHKSYGIVIGPLEQMEDADVVMMADYAEVIMRVMQGYAYKYGNPENLSFFGNQAACADLVSKPFSNNDINISLMCKGARAYGRFDKGEVGVSMPIGLFDSVVEGIVKTFTPVANAIEKKRVLNSIEETDELVGEIDMMYNYGLGLREYDRRVVAIRNSGENI